MDKKQIKAAVNLLADRVDRTETIGADTEGGFALTAYWLDDGQKLFYTLAQVEEHCKRGRGRPATGTNPPMQLGRVSAEDKATLHAAAHKAGKPFTQWALEKLLRAAERELDR